MPSFFQSAINRVNSNLSSPNWIPALIGLFMLLTWICFFNGISILYPIDKTEALQIEIARSMAVSGDWVTPSIDGLPYFDKPPLPYWIGALLLRLSPGQVWLPRLGAAITGCIGLITTFLLCRFGNREDNLHRRQIRATTAASILALMPAYIGFSRIALHDIYLTVSITISLTLFFLISQSDKPSTNTQLTTGLLIGIALGFGVLAKGLLSIALPIAIAVAFLITAGPSTRFRFSPGFGLALLLGLSLVALPWHLSAWHEQGSSFLQGYLGRTHFNRFTTELDNHTGPWFFYLLVYPVLTAPWGLLGIASLINANCFNPRRWRTQAASNPLLLFCTLWILITVGLLSLASTKLPHYILSCLPPTAIAASYFLWPENPSRTNHLRFSRILLGGTALVLLTAAILIALAPQLSLFDSTNSPDFSLAIRNQLSTPTVITSLSLLGLSAGWMSSQTKQPRFWLGSLWALLIVIGLVTLVPSVMQSYRLSHQGPRLELADAALRMARPGETIQVVGKSWYSVKIRTRGSAEILRRGKAFGEANAAPKQSPCSTSSLLLGPAASVIDAVDSCEAKNLEILQQDPRGRLSLARLTPAAK